VWFATNLRSSRIGRALAAVADSEAGTRSLGIDPAHYRLVALVFSAFVAGLGGVVAAYAGRPLDPTHFAVFLSVQYFLYTLVGGARSLAGAAVVVFAFEVAPGLHHGGPPTGPTAVLVLGALAVATLRFAPGGLAGLVRQAAGRLLPAGAEVVPAHAGFVGVAVDLHPSTLTGDEIAVDDPDEDGSGD
jgi:branched-chain amino acid transport system permease protein